MGLFLGVISSTWGVSLFTTLSLGSQYLPCSCNHLLSNINPQKLRAKAAYLCRPAPGKNQAIMSRALQLRKGICFAGGRRGNLHRTRKRNDNQCDPDNSGNQAEQKSYFARTGRFCTYLQAETTKPKKQLWYGLRQRPVRALAAPLKAD
jgi:hypothetical protein